MWIFIFKHILGNILLYRKLGDFLYGNYWHTFPAHLQNYQLSRARVLIILCPKLQQLFIKFVGERARNQDEEKKGVRTEKTYDEHPCIHHFKCQPIQIFLSERYIYIYLNPIFPEKIAKNKNKFQLWNFTAFKWNELNNSACSLPSLGFTYVSVETWFFFFF